MKSKSSLFVLVWLLVTFMALAGPAFGTSLADLAGTWNGSGFATGPGAPYWGRGTMTVSPNGTFTITDTENDASVHNQSGRLSISSSGISMNATGKPGALCQVDLGNTVMSCTTTWSDGTTNLVIFTKQAASCLWDDMTGNWEGSMLDSGPTSASWGRVSQTINPDGTFSGEYTSSNGGPPVNTAGAGSITSNGVLTCLSGVCGGPSYLGYLDAGKTITIGTSGATPTEGGDALLYVFVKKAVSYSMADLAGTWKGSGLASGAFAPWWERNTASINADGTYTGSHTGSDGSAGRTTGILSISPDGTISCVSGDCVHYSGVMDADKTVIVLTGTWSSGTTDEIYIFTKSAGPPGAPTGVSAAPGNGQAAVSFTLPAANGSTITGCTVTSNPGGITVKGRKSPIVVKRLANGTPYTFTVTATNKIGTSPPSDPSNSVTPAKVPVAPINVVATAGDSQATVSFNLPSSDGGSAITQYTVKSRPGGKTNTGAGSPIVVTELTDGTRYTFTVTATNEIGNGPASKPSNPVTPESILVGTWNVVNTTNITFPPIQLTFNSNGTGTSFDSTKSYSWKWTLTGSQLTATKANGETYSGPLTWSDSNDVTWVFTSNDPTLTGTAMMTLQRQ